MNPIIQFYEGEQAEGCNHIITDVWTYSVDHLESSHDYIQWLFPLKEPSDYNPDAPILTDEDIEILRQPKMITRVLFSVHTFMRFIYIWQENWVTRHDHNQLRITRMLRCLMLFGLKREAHARLEEVLTIVACYPNVHMDTAIEYWKDAVQDENNR